MNNVISILLDAYLKEHFEQLSYLDTFGGTYFSNMYAHAGDTTSNTTSVMSGYDIWGHGISQLIYNSEHGANAPYPKVRAFPMLAQLVKENNINTYLSGRDAHWLNLGYQKQFRRFDDRKDVNRLQFLCSNIDKLQQPFFLHVHLWHAHYHKDVGPFTIDDKLAFAKEVEPYVVMFMSAIWRECPNTDIILWSDHGDMKLDNGKIEHHNCLASEVQRVPCLHLSPNKKDMQTNENICSQADIFAIICDVFEISAKRDGVDRYAKNPVRFRREKLFAGSYYSEMVKRYPDGLLLPYDEMLLYDNFFANHIDTYGALLPIDITEPKRGVAREKLVELGYI
jgi:hypothetical protein